MFSKVPVLPKEMDSPQILPLRGPTPNNALASRSTREDLLGVRVSGPPVSIANPPPRTNPLRVSISTGNVNFQPTRCVKRLRRSRGFEVHRARAQDTRRR